MCRNTSASRRHQPAGAGRLHCCDRGRAGVDQSARLDLSAARNRRRRLQPRRYGRSRLQGHRYAKRFCLPIRGADPQALNSGTRLFRTCLSNRRSKYPSDGRLGNRRFSMAVTVRADNKTALFSAAATNAAKVLSLAPDDTVAHFVLGGVYIMTNRAAQGIAECERVLAIDRNSAWAHAGIGLAKLHMGRPAETEGHILEALRLSPRDTLAHQWMDFVGTAKMHLGADAEATGWLRRSIEANRNCPPAHFALAAALGQLGALDEAQTAAKAGIGARPQTLPSAVSASAHQATIRRTLLGGRGSVRDCV